MTAAVCARWLHPGKTLVRFPLLGVGIAVAVLAGASIRAAAVGQPIAEIRFDWSTYRSHAPGSDNWALTWCEDDHQYTTWGDGGGFGGTNTEGRTSLGFARITGPYTTFEALNLWGGVNSVTESEFGGKVISMVCLGGDLYAWYGPGSGATNLDYQHLILSEDKGITWNRDALPNSRVEGCAGCPGLAYTINYGRNYAANQDGYVYTFWVAVHDPDLWDVQRPGVLWLARAPVAGAAFTDQANWQWVIGFDASGNPRWGSAANRVPVLQDPDGFMRGSAIYVWPLGRFLMVTNHTSRNDGNIAIWDSPAPWGPWSLVLRDHDWPESQPGAPVAARFSFGNFAPKWFGTGGTGVFVWFGPDRWNSVSVTLLPEPGGWQAWITALLALASCGRMRRRQVS